MQSNQPFNQYKQQRKKTSTQFLQQQPLTFAKQITKQTFVKFLFRGGILKIRMTYPFRVCIANFLYIFNFHNQ